MPETSDVGVLVCFERNENLRMLIDEFGGIVNFIVDNDEEILLRVVLGNVLVGVLLGGHFSN